MDSPSSAGSLPPAAPPEQTEQLQDEETESSFFPSPPSFYLRYTTANLALPLDQTGLSVPATATAVEDTFNRIDLEPPNVDWILERGHYEVFGERWPIVELLPTLTEMGVQELFDKSVGEFTFYTSLTGINY